MCFSSLLLYEVLHAYSHGEVLHDYGHGEVLHDYGHGEVLHAYSHGEVLHTYRQKPVKKITDYFCSRWCAKILIAIETQLQWT